MTEPNSPALELRRTMFAEAVERFGCLSKDHGTEQDRGAALFLLDNLPALMAPPPLPACAQSVLDAAKAWCDDWRGGREEKLKLTRDLIDACRAYGAAAVNAAQPGQAKSAPAPVYLCQQCGAYILEQDVEGADPVRFHTVAEADRETGDPVPVQCGPVVLAPGNHAPAPALSAEERVEAGLKAWDDIIGMDHMPRAKAGIAIRAALNARRNDGKVTT